MVDVLEALVNRFVHPQRVPTPKGLVSSELAKVRKMIKLSPQLHDDYVKRAENYIEWVQRWGLEGEEVVASCFDLALTLAQGSYYQAVRQEIGAQWEQSRAAALTIVRPPKIIIAELDPQFFYHISIGRKTMEGRAYDPKRFSDIREGDVFKFSLSQRLKHLTGEALEYGLDQADILEAEVGIVNYGPTVHSVYQFGHGKGEDFQPTVSGPSEMLQIQRAAVYYTFPNYPERISQYGFLGIGLRDHRLIRAN